MDANKAVYRDLQKHLDRQAVGFPKTNSGAEIRLLRHIFSPKEARIATFLSYKPEPLETVFNRAKGEIDSKQALSEILDTLQIKGGIETQIKNGAKHYCNAPLLVGMYELQVNRLTPQFLSDFDQYTSDPKFGVAFLSTELPQMRTIPIGEKVKISSDVGTFDEVVSLVMQSNGKLTIVPCICREKKKIQGQSCHITDRKETCLAIGDFAELAAANHIGRAIDRDEAVSILEKNQKDGLVFQPSNTQQASFICSCCGCCCGMLNIHKKLPKPVDFWASNYFAVVDHGICEGCGKCKKKCQVNAVAISEKKAKIDLHRCIGCGLCTQVCPPSAITLEKKSNPVVPPFDREALYDILMAQKKGPLGKLKVAGKLVYDAVTTGQTQLFK